MQRPSRLCNAADLICLDVFAQLFNSNSDGALKFLQIISGQRHLNRNAQFMWRFHSWTDISQASAKLL